MNIKLSKTSEIILHLFPRGAYAECGWIILSSYGGYVLYVRCDDSVTLTLPLMDMKSPPRPIVSLSKAHKMIRSLFERHLAQ